MACLNVNSILSIWTEKPHFEHCYRNYLIIAILQEVLFFNYRYNKIYVMISSIRNGMRLMRFENLLLLFSKLVKKYFRLLLSFLLDLIWKLIQDWISRFYNKFCKKFHRLIIHDEIKSVHYYLCLYWSSRLVKLRAK